MKIKATRKIQDTDRALLEQELQKLQNISLNEGVKLVKQLRKSISALDFTSDVPLFAQILTEIGIFHGKSGQCDVAEIHFKQVLELAEKHQKLLKNEKSRAESNLAVCQAQTGNYLAAIDIWESMLEGDLEPKLRLGLINNIAVAYSAVGNQSKALSYSFDALNLADAIQEEMLKLPPLMNIANAYLRIRNFEKAESFVLQALEMSRKQGDIHMECDSLNNLSLIYYNARDFPKALEKAKECLNIHKKYYAKHEHAKAYNNIGLIYQEMGNHPQALKHYHESLKLVSSAGSKSDEANILLNMQTILILQKNFDEALSFSERLKTLIDEVNSHDLLERYYRHLSDIYDNLQDYEAAYRVQRELTQLLSTRCFETLKSSINKTEAEYYRKKIEEQAEDYRKQNQELKKKNRIIQNHSRELNKINKHMGNTMEALNWLVKVISHDVRAPLANFSKIIDLMQNGAFEEDEIDDVLFSLKKSIQNTFKLVDEMLDGIRLQSRSMGENARISQQDIVPHLQQIFLIYQQVAMQKLVNLDFNYHQDQLYALVDSDLLKIVVRNLINNAIKFTPEQGKVSLQAQKYDSMVQITISDTGAGMSKKKLKELLSKQKQASPTRSADGGIGLGWVLLKESIKIMKGNMTVESQPGVGTTVIISLPA